MTFVGMDPVEVRTVADGLLARARDLDEVRARVDGLIEVAAMTWLGPDSDAFRELWNSTLRGGVGTVSQELAARSTWLLAQIDQQVEVSAAYGVLPSRAGRSDLDACELPPPRAPTPYELMRLADAAYGGVKDTVGYVRITDPAELQRLGIEPSSLHLGSGLEAAVFRYGEGEDARYVLAFKGSLEGSDWVSNLAGSHAFGAPGVNPQAVQAMHMARALAEHVSTDRLTFTGHSLGGHLAAVSAVVTGATAVTFDAAGVSQAERAYASALNGSFAQAASAAGAGILNELNPLNRLPIAPDFSRIDTPVDESRIVNYRADDDPLSAVQDASAQAPDALGRQVTVRGDGHDLLSLEEALRGEQLPWSADGGW